MAEVLETIQYLAFNVADELVAIDAIRVREILATPGIGNDPQLSDFMRGVINLRGCAVPVIDLRLKFAEQKTARTISSCTIFVDVTMSGENVILGAIAGDVQDVTEVEPSQAEAMPHWLRCRFSKNDYMVLSKVFINAAHAATNMGGTTDVHNDEINLPVQDPLQ